jgi:hypothetical protein
MCRAFVGAYPQAITIQNAQAGFMKAGIVPCNPDELKQSESCPDTTAETRLHRSQLKPGLANNRLLTSDEEIQRLRRPEAQPRILIGGLRLERNTLLSALPTMIVRCENGAYQEVSILEILRS